MAEYVAAAIETDPSALADESFEEMNDRVPGWSPAPGDPLTIVFETGASMAAEGRDVGSDVPPSIFRYFGAKLAGLPPTEAAPARATATFVAADALGYTIEDGAEVGYRAAGDELVLFTVDGEVTVPPGSTTTAAGEVDLVAEEDGAAGNGIPAGTALEMVSSTTVAWTIALATDTTGGADDETDDEYQDRLSDELTLQSPRPILARDFAVLARRVDPVDRALAIDLYKPGPPYDALPADANAARCVTVAVVDAAGEPVPALARSAVDALLQSMREVNFLVFVVDPTYTTIAATYAATAYPGFDAADVLARADEALRDYLGPQDFGVPPFSEERAWVYEPKVRYLEVAEVLNRVDGLWRVDSLAIGISGGAMGTADVTLAGVAPLPRAGAGAVAGVGISGAVVAG